ncbi:hypothetical protein HX889_09240 [Pseudomonas reactans]|nr:hypothetical protein [Pseudomonas reactans]
MPDDEKIRSIDEIIQDLVSKAKIMVTVDFDKLESEGVVEKVRGGYLVKKYSLVPETAMRYLVKSITPTKTGTKNILFKPSKNITNLASKNN